MLKYFLAIAAAAIFFHGANALQVNTPSNVVQCQPILLTWGNGTAPYYLSIVPGDAPLSSSLHDFSETNDLSVTWVVNYRANTNLGLRLRDSTGVTAQSASFTVQNSSMTACLNSTSSVGASTGTTIPGTTTAPSPPRATTTSGTLKSTGGGTGVGTGTGSTPTSGSASQPTSSASSADKVIVNSAMVGAIGAAVFALLV